MKEKFQVFEIDSKLDELGDPEELTWDLFPVVKSEDTSHLDENGLPKTGTTLESGMILVGKIGKTKDYSPDNEPSALDIHGLSFDELRRRFGHMWKDCSKRVPAEFHGVVVESKLETRDNGRQVAIVRVRVPQRK